MSLPPRLRRASAALAILLAVSAAGAGTALAVQRDVPPAMAGISLPARPAADPALEPALAGIADEAAARGVTAARALAEFTGAGGGGDVSVVVEPLPGRAADLERSAEGMGAAITGRADGALRVSVSPLALRRLASLPGVLRVRRPARPVKTAVSEGVRMMNADRWQALGQTGAGAKVGIIDVGFKDYETLSSLGLLPPATQIATKVFDTSADGHLKGFPAHAPIALEGDPHGSAVAETVHDVAPGAKLYFAAIYDEIDLAAAVEWMHANGVQVVSMSLGWVGVAPLDGGDTPGADNIVNNAVDKAVNTYGMFWVNAAGNFREQHWRGNYVPSSEGHSIKWNASGSNVNAFHYDGASSLEGVLWWKDSWTKAINDYDLVLLKYNPSLHAWQSVLLPIAGTSPVRYQGETPQSGRTGDKPFESIVVQPGRLAAGTYGWAIVNMRPWKAGALPANSPWVDFDFFCPNQGITSANGYRSIMTPADNESAGFVAVAAISSRWGIDSTFERPGFAVQERYSSQGPNAHGKITPEIAAPDDTTNRIASMFSEFGGTFRGTSASAPHVAGLAALVKAANKTFTAAQVETYLKNNAIDLTEKGPDTKTGWGAANVPATRSVDLARQAGADRYHTALAMSAAWKSGSVSSVVLVCGANFPDALTGSSLAGAYGSPILLCPTAKTLPDIRTELHRLTSGAAKPTVFLLGGEASLSSTVESELRSSGFTTVRLGGRDRYETGAKVAAASAKVKPTRTAFVVDGRGYADGLSVSPVAYRQGFPVLPVAGDKLPASIEAFIRDQHIDHVIVVGSTKSVGTAVRGRLASMGITLDEWWGATRYDTMRDVVQKASSKGWIGVTHIGIASGANFPDALAGGAETGHAGGALLISQPAVLSDQAGAVLSANAGSVRVVRVYGSESALQGSVLLGARWKSEK